MAARIAGVQLPSAEEYRFTARYLGFGDETYAGRVVELLINYNRARQSQSVPIVTLCSVLRTQMISVYVDLCVCVCVFVFLSLCIVGVLL